MDEDRARALLSAQRAELESLLRATDTDSQEDREAEDEAAAGDVDDPAQLLTSEGQDDAITQSLRDRLAAVKRAEERLANGTLRLHAWFFKIATAELFAYSPETNQFLPLVENAP